MRQVNLRVVFSVSGSFRCFLTYRRRDVIATAVLLYAATVSTASAVAVSEEEIPHDFTGLSIEELMNIEIISVSKRPQKLSDAAAAVYVITEEDIRRSGVTSIPEALRMVPGVEVARIDANKWAISARGFTDRFANKLLVLVDGRTVYTPLFSGVYWEVQDYVLEDIERIEVIRGPGAALWGANAVNGVINIITKNAKDTQGGLVSSGVGTEERGFGSFRYGGKSGENTFYRVYVKYLNRDDFVYEDGHDADDDWDMGRGGFRIDSDISPQDTLTLQGDMYRGELGTRFVTRSLQPRYYRVINDTEHAAGANLLGRWKRVISDRSDVALQIYYDLLERDSVVFGENRDTFDLDFQHHRLLGDRHNVVWGAGYRFTHDDVDGSFTAHFDPETRDDHLISAFAQDEIALVREKLKLTLGSKFEHNDYSGSEVQPNARLLWNPHEHHTFWTAVSRAIRSPARYEHTAQVVLDVMPPGVAPNLLPYPMVIAPTSDDDFDSEDLLAHEFGYRVLITESLNVDTALFYNKYDDLLTAEAQMLTPVPPSSPQYSLIPLIPDNKMDGETYGTEIAVDYKPLDWWRLQAAYTYTDIQLHYDGDTRGQIFEEYELRSPQNQVSLRSSMDWPHNVEFDLWARYVDDIPVYEDPEVESYVTLDARIGWRPKKNFDLTVALQNLLDSQHAEFGSSLIDTRRTEVERGIYIKATWYF